MKRLSSLLLLLCVVDASAAPIEGLTVQGRLLSQAGVAAPDGLYDVTLSLWTAETGGEEVWDEAHSGDTGMMVKDGTFWMPLAAIQPMDTTLLTAGPLWLQIQIGAEQALPRQRLQAVPYAGVAQSLACSGCLTASHLAAAVLAPYAKTEDLPNMNAYALVSDLPDLGPYALLSDLSPYALLSDLSPYAKTTDLPDMSLYALLTQIPDLAPYAKTNELPDMSLYALLTQIPDLGPYAKTSELPDMSLYALLTQLPDLAPYAKTNDLPDMSLYATTAALAPYAKTDDIAGIVATLGYVSGTCVGCVSKDMIEPGAAGEFTAQTSSLPWSAITDKPAGFADDTDNAGGALVSSEAQICDTNQQGRLWYSTTEAKLQFCDGANWNIVQMAIAPTTPQALSAQTASNSSILLTWNSVVGVDKYKIYRSTDNVTFSELQATVGTQYTDANLSPNTSYSYRVSSSNGAGESDPSSPVTGTTAFDYIGSSHTASECTTAGGSVTGVSGDSNGSEVCRFSAAACPSGWSQTADWSTTQKGTCGVTGRYGGGCEPVIGGMTCTSSEHAWSDSALLEENSCSHNCGGSSNACGSANKACPSGTALCYESCLPNPQCQPCKSCVAVATRIEIGCR